MFKRKDGLWQEKMTINGKPVYFYASKKSDLLQKIRNYKVKQEKGELFSDVADQWWEKHSAELAPNTLKGYKPAYVRAKDRQAGKYIADIKYSDLQSHLDDMSKYYKSLKVSQTQRLIYNLIFKFAYKRGYVTSNPAIGLECHGTKTKRLVPSDATINIIKSNYNAPFGLFPYLILYTGLRRGEALALRYEDIDRDRNLICVTKSVYYLNNNPYIKKPKTEAGERMVPLLQPLKDVLPNKKHGYIFAGSDKKLLREYEVEDLLISYRKATGAKFTPHQLRHAYATIILFENGISAKDAQEILGHAQISTTLDIYTEFRENRAEKLSEKLNALIT